MIAPCGLPELFAVTLSASEGSLEFSPAVPPFSITTGFLTSASRFFAALRMTVGSDAAVGAGGCDVVIGTGCYDNAKALLAVIPIGAPLHCHSDRSAIVRPSERSALPTVILIGAPLHCHSDRSAIVRPSERSALPTVILIGAKRREESQTDVLKAKQAILCVHHDQQVAHPVRRCYQRP